MDKATQRALEEFPDATPGLNEYDRKCYIYGYHQAEKDLALTWHDIDLIVRIHDDVMEEAGGTPKDFAEETLRRFNEQRIKNDND